MSITERVLLLILGLAPMVAIPVIFFFVFSHQAHPLGRVDLAMFAIDAAQFAAIARICREGRLMRAAAKGANRASATLACVWFARPTPHTLEFSAGAYLALDLILLGLRLYEKRKALRSPNAPEPHIQRP
jgi:hypothetical protein